MERYMYFKNFDKFYTNWNTKFSLPWAVQMWPDNHCQCQRVIGGKIIEIKLGIPIMCPVEVTYINIHRCPKTSIHQNCLQPWWGCHESINAIFCQHCDSDPSITSSSVTIWKVQVMYWPPKLVQMLQVVQGTTCMSWLCIGTNVEDITLESLHVLWTSCGSHTPILMENI